MAQAITTMAAKKSTVVSGILMLPTYGGFCCLINAERQSCVLATIAEVCALYQLRAEQRLVSRTEEI
jgi:hypothetical protein